MIRSLLILIGIIGYVDGYAGFLPCCVLLSILIHLVHVYDSNFVIGMMMGAVCSVFVYYMVFV